MNVWSLMKDVNIIVRVHANGSYVRTCFTGYSLELQEHNCELKFKNQN